MITTAKFSKEMRNDLQKILSDWKRRRSNRLYREVDGFVQWIAFQASKFDVAVRLSYSILCLAEQFPAATLTQGALVRKERCGESPSGRKK